MSYDIKYVGMDVHEASISIAVRNAAGKLTMEAVIPTQAAAILDFLRGLRGTLWVTFEETSQAEWLYWLLRPHVAKVLVCNPRKNARLKVGDKNDRIDARKLSELLRAGLLSPVYHGDHGMKVLKERLRRYANLTEDTTRVKNRLKAVYRSRAIACPGKKVYTQRHRSHWRDQLTEPGPHRRAERLYQQLDALQPLRTQAGKEMVAEARKFSAYAILRSLCGLGPIRVTTLLARVQPPHRFRSKRQFWKSCGFALGTRDSAQHRFVDGPLKPAKKLALVRGLNVNHSPELKDVFKGAALHASTQAGPWHQFYLARLALGMDPDSARLTLARKIAAVALHLWKKGERFDATQLTSSAA